MLNASFLRLQESRPFPVLSSVTSINEGSGLVHYLENGLEKVSNGTGSNSEIFKGVAMHQLQKVTKAGKVQRIVVPATGTNVVNLDKVPVGGVSAIRIVGVGYVFTVNPVAGDGLFTVADNAVEYDLVSGVGKLSFHTDELGKTFDVYYQYTPSAAEAQAIQGDGYPGAEAPAIADSITAITRGLVYTDQFDSGADWTVNNIATCKVGASGVFQIGGTGAAFAGTIAHTPEATIPFLGLNVTV